MTALTVCQQAANAILRAFDEVPYPVRMELGTSMMAAKAGNEYGFIALLGLYLTHSGAHPADSPMVQRYLTAAVANAVESGGATNVVEALGDEEPWATVKRALEFAIAGPVVPEDRERRPDPREAVT